MNTRSQQQSFGTLPPELRVRIYIILIAFDQPLRQVDNGSEEAKTALDVEILAVSKLIHQEAIDVYYYQNTFFVNLCSICPERSDITPLQLKGAERARSIVLETIGSDVYCRVKCEDAIFAVAEGKLFTQAPPKLQSITIRLSSTDGKRFLPNLDITKSACSDTIFTNIGCFKANASELSKPTIEFVHPRLLEICSGFANLGRQTFTSITKSRIALDNKYVEKVDDTHYFQVISARNYLDRLYKEHEASQAHRTRSFTVLMWAARFAAGDVEADELEKATKQVLSDSLTWCG